MIIAAIDLGTVTSRLLVANVKDGIITPLRREMIMTHMGEGLNTTGRIGDAAVKRLLNAVSIFKDAILDVQRIYVDKRDSDGVMTIPVYAVATSAMRDASNSAEVLHELSNAGINVEIIAGKREAALSFAGTLSGFTLPQEPEPVMSVDVGGGSTEVIAGIWGGAIASTSLHSYNIIQSHSFNIGSRRVTDMFLACDPPSSDELHAARDWIRDGMASFFQGLGERPKSLYAVAGTATTVVSVRDAMEPYDPDKVHGSKVTRAELQEVSKRLASVPTDKRRNIVGLHPDRASVILGGLITLDVVMELIGMDAFTVSETDILQGILLDSAH
jgi:exopolyphosphatase/guanosine-5'-triphosphate,3'-diphosphate pyrophosphatase